MSEHYVHEYCLKTMEKAYRKARLVQGLLRNQIGKDISGGMEVQTLCHFLDDALEVMGDFTASPPMELMPIKLEVPLSCAGPDSASWNGVFLRLLAIEFPRYAIH